MEKIVLLFKERKMGVQPVRRNTMTMQTAANNKNYNVNFDVMNNGTWNIYSLINGISRKFDGAMLGHNVQCFNF